ncbi:trigger factor [Thiospirochaeta perfilievii]|uniref:Trigger factor n=1 Tax=Thiospirochaeta perfilievii TaxID=252967 RepID=A0A5C1Q9C1_9SPIO|nr:trigger factor [Thiospirochaeta perfilievii]QEN04067.1 trigger factor [Thiospirochaeta perfilievii]
MISKKNIEKLENSAVKLSVSVDKAESKKEYNSLINKYSKSVQIKGFRKGKVPTTILEKRFGESLKQEAASNLLEKAFKLAVEDIEEKPLGIATPELVGDLDFNPEEEFSFTVKYDVFPEVKLGEYKGLEIEEPKVSILKKHKDAELEKIQEQNSIVIDKASKTIASKNIVTMNYAELDEQGEVIEDTKREDFVFTVGTGYNYYKLDDDVIKMKVDQEKVIEKTYPADFEVKELAGTTKKIQVKITAVKEKQLPALDDELAQDVSEDFNTLDDLKASIETKLKDQVKERVENITTDNLLLKIVENSELIIPESMINAELENRWRNFMQQSRMTEENIEMFLQLQGQTKQGLKETWKEDAEKTVKSQILLEKILEKEDVKVSDKDVADEIKTQSEMYKMPEDELKDTFEKNGMMEYLKKDIKTKKLIKSLLKSATITKGEKVDYNDFMMGKI